MTPPAAGGDRSGEPTTNVEDEQKFTVTTAFSLPPLDDPEHGLTAVPEGVLDLTATYHDTVDLALAREGITLRRRTGEGRPVWTLKLPVADGSTARTEVTLPARGEAVPARLTSLLTAWLRGARLEPVTTLRTRRTVVSLRDATGAEVAEVVDDEVQVLDGAPSRGGRATVTSEFREVEVERRGISDAAHDATLARLVNAGAVHGQQVSKAIRAMGPRAATPPDLPRPHAVRPAEPAAGLVALALRTDVRRLLVADLAVRREETDGVHRLRVACRHLRSDLRTLRALVEPRWATLLRDELSWLADGLGAARDLEVLRDRVAVQVADWAAVAEQGRGTPADPETVTRLDALLDTRHEAARRSALTLLGSARYLRLVQSLVDAAREPVLTAQAAAPSAAVLPGLLAHAWRRLEHPVRRLDTDGPDTAWHTARIRAKQVRYAGEAFEPVLGVDARRTARAARGLQEHLGSHQDAVVGGDALLALAVEHPSDGPLGVLVGRLAQAWRHEAQGSRDSLAAEWARARRRVPERIRKAARRA